MFSQRNLCPTRPPRPGRARPERERERDFRADMATGVSTSTIGSSGKRRWLESKLRDTKLQLRGKTQGLQNAKVELEKAGQKLEKAEQKFEEAESNVRRWHRKVSKRNRKVSRWNRRMALASSSKKREAAEMQRDLALLEMDSASKEREHLIIERDFSVKEQREAARKDREAAKANVESCQKDLDMLEEQLRTTKGLLDKFQPDTSKYFRAIAAVGPPSGLGSRHTWWKAQNPDRSINPLYLCFVPPEAQPGMPVELAEKVFSEFLVNAKECVVDQHDCEITDKLCRHVGQQLENEHAMACGFREMLTKYLGDSYPVSVSSMSCPSQKKLYPNDGCVIISSLMALLMELKLEPKTTLFQAQQHYAVYMSNKDDKLREKSFWPCFLIELVGTCIRISGLVYFDKVACQPLTPFLHCYINDFDRSDMNTLCRAMRALKTGVHKLAGLGSAAVTRNKNIPYHLCSSGWEFQQRFADKLMFVMKALESGELKVVKFCKQCGVSVHKAWAAQGLAPKLIDWNLAQDGWYAIEMEFLDPAEWTSVYEWLISSQSAISKIKLQETIKEALARAHEVIIDGRKTAHGDMRCPNIMVRESNKDGQVFFEVKFVDFDWSGIVGETLYPSFMNMELEWHQDAGPGKLLHQQHDIHWVDHIEW